LESESDGLLSSYEYDLPSELIAQHPTERREDSRLLVLGRDDVSMEDRVFRDLPDLLRPGDLLVANESRVIPARLFGTLDTGGRVELLLVRETAGGAWEVMARPARKLRVGVTVLLAEGVTAEVEGELGEGRRVVQFRGAADFASWLDGAGVAPLPPYIHEAPADVERYQTVYARSRGSVAAPTAGLHFTDAVLEQLGDRGVEMRFVTLHVGPGTFKPVTEENLERVELEPEIATVSAETAAAVRSAKAEGRRVIAVGTTTTRTLEGLAAQAGEVTTWNGALNSFIRPPFQFRVVDGLITNFHLPRSSLLMLVSAFAGRERVREAYRHAVAERYRFYSFGDAMFIA
jgi:S-adenosylmethionine:tRNA ribosyltransferase-isomerase